MISLFFKLSLGISFLRRRTSSNARTKILEGERGGFPKAVTKRNFYENINATNDSKHLQQPPRALAHFVGFFLAASTLATML